jgi:hypothetical protein
MDYLRLTLGLMLPWIGSYYWLAALEARASDLPAHRARQIGVSFLFAMALLSGLLLAQSQLNGGISYWPVLGVICAFSFAGYLAYARSIPVKFVAPAEKSARTLRLLYGLLTAWILLHLALIAFEILHRPIFPWDAWQTWMYRSKAWFYLGEIVPMDSPQAWIQGKASAAYNTYAADYPRFVSVIALWSATALGAWNEPLINLPYLLCGLALVLALYGYGREAGLPRWAAALGAYLLISIPLIGSHLALAGQADIWLTGYAGLGFVALIWGIVRHNAWHLATGLLLVCLGIWVKHEGLVWMLAALLVLALTTRPRLCALVACVGLAAVSVAWISGIHTADLPYLGTIGIREGSLHIPLLGQFALMQASVLDDYWVNFFVGSTWHLLWPLLIICLLALPALPASPIRSTVSAFFCVLVATQLAIFFFSEQGRWAEDWTAINRLPMHIAPALIFSLLLTAQQIWRQIPAGKPRIGHWVAPTVAFIAVTLIAGAYVYVQSPPTKGYTRNFDANQLQIVVGGGFIRQGTGYITRFDNGIAVVSDGSARIDTGDSMILRLNTGGNNGNKRRFFWRNGPDEDDLHSLDIGEPGEKTIDLGSHPQWRGTVTELGLLFLEDGGKSVEVTSLQIGPRSANDMLTLTWEDWTTLSRWSQKSVHFLPAGADSTPLKLPLFMAGWIAATTLAGLLLIRLNPTPTWGIALCAVISWLLLDLRWTSNLIGQANATHHFYSSHHGAHLDIAPDSKLYDLTQEIAPLLQGSSDPVLVVSEEPGRDFEALRVKYHLLPVPALARKGTHLGNYPKFAARHVLIVRSPYLAPGEKPVNAAGLARRVSATLGLSYGVVLDTEAGVLLSAR